MNASNSSSILPEAFDLLSLHAKGTKKISLIIMNFIDFNIFTIDLYLDKTVCELFELPIALDFTRDYVGKNRPLVIRKACSNWKACKEWNEDYFRSL